MTGLQKNEDISS